MGEYTKIEWADHTFNPWEGCQKVGPGCDHCYAETRNIRYAEKGATVAPNWGPGAPRRRTSTSNWRKPLKWQAEAPAFFAEHGRKQTVFCASLADVFDKAAPEGARADLAALIRATPDLTWLLLTKRIGNVVDMLWEMFEANVPANFRVGATIVNQEEWDRDAGKIAKVAVLIGKARIFLSMEPLLAPVDFGHTSYRFAGIVGWVIAGGESGAGARPMHPEWLRSLRDQCAADVVPFLFKQWGEWKPFLGWKDGVTRYADASGSYGPESIFRFDGGQHVVRVGKKAAGRLLAGVEHNGYPS